MGSKSIVLVVDHRGGFEVRVKDIGGFVDQIAWDYDLSKCLSTAAQRLGHEILIPLCGQTTSA